MTRLAAVLGTLVAASLALAASAARRPTPPDGPALRLAIEHDADSLDAALAAMDAVVRHASGDHADVSVRSAFRAARSRYKHMEGVVEFYSPAIASGFNSRRQELDDDDAPPPSSLAASGFPALEGLLWPRYSPSSRDPAAALIAAMRHSAARLHAMAGALSPTNAQLIEIARQEIARVSTLGISGFDTPLSRDAMIEGADAFEGVGEMLALSSFKTRFPRQHSTAAVHLAQAASYLREHPQFDTFNRLAFVAIYAERAARAVDTLRLVSQVAPVRIIRAWRADVPSVYDAGAFDVRAYAPSGAVSSPTVVALGRRLFFDPALSGTGQRSCASCHNPSMGFADGVRKADRIDHAGAVVARNTPTLINAGLQPSQFSDERAASLEDQVGEVLRSPGEMSSSIDRVSTMVRANARYAAEFARAFPGDAQLSGSPLEVRQSLAAYVRTLTGLSSRFDRAVRGDTSALSADERHGFTLFMGKAGCGTCHFAPLFSGNTPPRYMASDVEVIGTPRNAGRFADTDADSGRAAIDGLALHLRAFKTPTLRNISLTAPYMHNGVFATLEQVVAFYNAGGGKGAGAALPNQTLNADSLRLSGSEQHALIAFMRSLTDTAGIGGR